MFDDFDDAQLGTEQIGRIFSDEIAEAGGTVHENWSDGSRLFARSVLPATTEIQPGDSMKGGVALRASDAEIRVHPYTFRLVCTNGAIHAHAMQSRQIVLEDWMLPEVAESQLREAIRMCCAPEAFIATAGEMRQAVDANVDLLLALSPMLSRLSNAEGKILLLHFMEPFGGKRRGSRYDLVNVITAAAREVRDPESKWRMEELGGAVAAGKIPTPQPELGARRRVVRIEQLTA